MFKDIFTQEAEIQSVEKEYKEDILALMEMIRQKKADGKDAEDLELELEEKMERFLTTSSEAQLLAAKDEISDLIDAIILRKAEGEDYSEYAQELKRCVKKYISGLKQDSKCNDVILNAIKAVL